jgi:hypothetical protein
MIFVYPAIASSTLDNKIVGGVMKVLEQYFLLHLQESIQANTIRFVTDWDRGDQAYGPLKIMREHKKIDSASVLKESASIHDYYLRKYGVYRSYLNAAISKNLDPIIAASKGLSPDYYRSLGKPQLEEERIKLYELLRKIDVVREHLSQTNDELDAIDVEVANVVAGDGPDELTRPERGSLSQERGSVSKIVDTYLHQIDRYVREWNSLLKVIDSRFKERDPVDDRLKRKEYEEKQHAQYETHGMYKVEPMKGVSLKPTMANISVKIHHRGGPRPESQQMVVGEMRDISIGTKVLPLRMSDFSSIEDAILDDYFTTKFQAIWKQHKRNFLRVALTKIQRWLGDLFDVRSHLDPVNANILLSNQGFVSGSSFEHKASTSPIYKHSAAIVIFNKQDLMKEEGANFFLNRSQVKRMFDMGWNAFCILDPVREEMMFISRVDGGYLHIIPYSYIFNTLGMDDVFKNINDLQKRSPIFRNYGNFSTLSAKLKKESTLVRSVKRIMGR